MLIHSKLGLVEFSLGFRVSQRSRSVNSTSPDLRRPDVPTSEIYREGLGRHRLTSWSQACKAAGGTKPSAVMSYVVKKCSAEKKGRVKRMFDAFLDNSLKEYLTSSDLSQIPDAVEALRSDP